jgi:voltage-gated potassium channel
MAHERQLRDGRAYDRFKAASEIPLLVAALAFIPVFVAPLVFNLSAEVADALRFVSWLIWAAFVVEYLVLFALAPSRWHMVKTHVFDLLIIVLPFLRPLRAARSARLLRVFAVSGRIGVGLRSLRTRQGVQNFSIAVAALVVTGGLLTYAFERNHEGSNIESLSDSMWWAVVTTTTVGYGDHTPVSGEGRGVAVVLMLVGIGIIGVLTANIAAFFVEVDEEDNDADVRERLDRIEQLLNELLAEKATITAKAALVLHDDDQAP